MLVPASASPRWQRINSLPARQREIFRAGFTFGCFLAWDHLRQQTGSPRRRRQRAQWLVNTLLSLGPTFIKIGQFLSTRVDLLPLEYVEALSELHDQVPQFDSKQAISIIETELNQPLYQLYQEFNAQPLAAASLGQVYWARLYSGEEVVVKVQRPGLPRLLELDYLAIGRFLQWLQRFLPADRRTELAGIYEEFFAILRQEVDYRQEGKNADRFRVNFANHPRIVVPEIFWQHCSEKVLTMTYLPGIKIDNRTAIEAYGLDPKQINQIGICCYLKQLLEDGFFHADPHPGNLAVTEAGDLIFYDYGMMAEVMALDKAEMVKTFFAVLRKDGDQVIQALTSMGLLESMRDPTPMKRVMQLVLDEFTEKPLDVKAFERMKHDVYALFEQQPFRLPSKLTYILKSLTTLDGIARILDPEYNLTAAAQPFVRGLAKSQGRGQIFGELARQARQLLSQKFNQSNSMQKHLLRLEERLERGELQLSVRASESERTLRQIQLTLKCLLYAVLAGFTFLSGTILLTTAYTNLAIASFVLAGLSSLALVRSLVQLSTRERINRMLEK
jgi:predicted unusual protein kinase regulating ubiquinone biosynthesis (AarF/ABC1/UbiB family)